MTVHPPPLLVRLERLERLERFERFERFERLERFERFERLERFERPVRLDRFRLWLRHPPRKVAGHRGLFLEPPVLSSCQKSHREPDNPASAKDCDIHTAHIYYLTEHIYLVVDTSLVIPL